MNNKQLALAIAVAVACRAALTAPSAADAEFLTTLQQAHPGTRFTSIAASDVPGLYEVWMGANVAFVAAKNPRYFIFGRVVDTTTMTDLTGPKLALAQQTSGETQPGVREEARIAVEQLPLADALKTVRGTGARTLYTFSDPACAYCRRLEPELAKLQDVTIYTFVLPFLGRELPQSILCSTDPAQNWHQWMLNADRSGLAAKIDCASAVDRNQALAQRLGVSGTPTLFYADGSRTAGYVAADELERRLSIVTAGRAEQVSAKTAREKLQ